MAAGFRQASALQAADQRLRRWCAILRHLALILSEGTCTLPEALTLVSTQEEQPDQLLCALSDRLQRDPLRSLPQLWDMICPDAPESPLLTRMMQRLCRGTIENRCLAVQQAAEEMELLSAHAAEKSAKDAKMWRTLGFLGGACITIMLL